MNQKPAMMPMENAPSLADEIEELPVAYVEMDAHGAVTRANRITRGMHSSHVGELIGKLAWELMPTEEQELSAAAFVYAMETGVEPGVSRRSIYTSADTFRIYDLHRNLIRDAEGKPIGMRAVSVDVTESVMAQQEAEKALRWMECAFTAFPDAVILTDTLGTIRSANPAAEELFGWKAGELTGQDFEEVFSPQSVDGQTKVGLVTVLSKSVRGEAMMRDHEGHPLRVEIRSSPMLEKEHGFTAGVVSEIRRVEEVG